MYTMQQMDAQAFWSVVGAYNQQTLAAQVALLLLVLAAAVLSYFNKAKWAAKLALGVIHLFIGIAFFACHGAAPVQKYFALPLFLLCGILFLYESYRNKNDALRKLNGWQCLLLLLYLFYPLISFLLGNRFPQIVTHVMPCPVASLGIIILRPTAHSCQRRLYEPPEAARLCLA